MTVDIISSDWHLNNNPRDQYRFDFLERRLPKLISKYARPRLLMLGDLTEEKNYHSAELVNRIVDAMVKLLQQVEALVILRGNHDSDADSGNPFFRFLVNLPAVSYVNHPVCIDEELYLPHARDPVHDWQGLDFAKVRRIFAHATFTGAIGDNATALKGVALDLLPEVPIISGDVHRPQRLGRVLYVGAPYHIDFGDDYQPRVLLLEGDKIKSVVLGGVRKLVITVDRAGVVLAGDPRPGDILRVQVKLQGQDHADWSAIRAQVNDSLPDYQIDSIIPLLDATLVGPLKRGIRAPLSDAQVLAEYCQRFQIDARTAEQGIALL